MEIQKDGRDESQITISDVWSDVKAVSNPEMFRYMSCRLGLHRRARIIASSHMHFTPTPFYRNATAQRIHPLAHTKISRKGCRRSTCFKQVIGSPLETRAQELPSAIIA
jgi:hypothetical protein